MTVRSGGGGNLKVILRNKNVQKLCATKILSRLVRRKVCTSSAINISTNTVFKYGCGSHRVKQALHCGAEFYGSGQCVKLGD